MSRRVLFFLPCSDTGGIATAFLALAEELETRGGAVKVLLPTPEDRERTVIPPHYVAGVAFRPHRWPRALLRVENLFHWVTGWRFFFAGIPRIPHDRFVVFQGGGFSFWRRYSDRPTLAWLHGLIPETRDRGWRAAMWDVLNGRCYRRFDRLIAVSDAVADVWQKRYRLPVRPTVFPNLMDVDGIVRKAAEPCVVSGERVRPRVLCVARLSPEKGVDRLLRIAGDLFSEGEAFDLWIVGDGTERVALEALARDCGIARQVRFFGACPNPYPFMKAADLLVLSSREEGFPLVIREALLLECPVLATDCGGVRQALHGGAWGMLVENDDAALKAGLQLALARPETCRPEPRFAAVARKIREEDAEQRRALPGLFGFGERSVDDVPPMCAFLVNLNRSPGRLAEADAQLRGAGIAYERVSAVDGRALSLAEVRRACSPLRFWIANARRIQPAELGCALSHLSVYRRMVAENLPVAMVFEDDIAVEPEALRKALRRMASEIDPAEPAVWLLHGCPAGSESLPDGIFPVRERASCAGAYVLTLAAAKRLLRQNVPVLALADAWSRWWRCGIPVFWVTPFACRQRGEPSQIGWKPPARARWRWYIALWRVRHAFGVRVDRLLIWLTGR